MTDIITVFDNLFNHENCSALACKKQFVKRQSSKLRGYEYIKMMIVLRSGIGEESLTHLCRHIEKLNPQASITSQALAKRINSKESVSLFKAVFSELLGYLNKKVVKGDTKLEACFNNFSRVLLQDSTVVKLNEKLQKFFKGTNRGGTSGKSQLKIDLIHDIKSDQTIDASLYDGNKPDQGLSKRIQSYLQKSDLVIRDLGYFSTTAFKDIENMGAYYLSRINGNVNIYLNKTDTKPIDLYDYLRTNHLHSSIINLTVYIGKIKKETRLVIYRQSKKITSKRLLTLSKNKRSKNETISKSRKVLAHYAVFVTNVPEDIMSADIVGTIYRLRWEIELIFKQWKSQLKIHVLKGINPNRIETLIWARLCTILLLSIAQRSILHRLGNGHNIEISQTKLINYLKFDNLLFNAVLNDTLEDLINLVIKDIKKCSKQSRKRKTMRERVCDEECFIDSAEVELEYTFLEVCA